MSEFLNRIPRKCKIAALAGAVVLFIALIAAVVIWSSRNKEDASVGLQTIRKMEKKDTDEIEAKIDELDRVEDEKRQRDESGMTSAETFSNAGAIVLGDSFAQGFSDNGILNASSVVAKGDILLTDEDDIQEEIDSAKGLDPKVVFISFGSADVKETDGDIDEFRTEYKDTLVNIQRSFSDATIYVCLITPVQTEAYAVSAAYMNVSKYNEALKELCRENNVIAVDNGNIITEDMYEEDGISLKADYYEARAKHLIEMAGL
jgi:lysophospholipase L1-like esterase